jgi:hypothetical protein
MACCERRDSSCNAIVARLQRAIFRFLAGARAMPKSTPKPIPQLDLINGHVVSVPKAARHYDVHPATMWRWVLSGKVASVKLNGSRKTTLEAVAAAFQADDKQSDIDAECEAAGI